MHAHVHKYESSCSYVYISGCSHVSMGESLGTLWGLLIVMCMSVSGMMCVSVCLDTLTFIPEDVEVCVCCMTRLLEWF